MWKASLPARRIVRGEMTAHRGVLTIMLAGWLSLSPLPSSGGADLPNGPILVGDSDLIASMRPDGSGYRVLVENYDHPGGGRWSPDKTRFAYHQTDDGSELYVREANGESPVLVATNAYFQFSWSSDGRHLAYTAPTGKLLEGSCRGIWVVDVETGAKHVVADGVECRVDDPQWSPTDTEIAFTDGQDSGGVDPQLDIYKVDVTTGEITQLTDAPGIDRSPRWSPDGSSIAFESSRDHEAATRVGGCMRRTEIYRMKSDGSHQVRLTGALRNPDCNPTWSPDGRHIAWTTSLTRKEGEPRRPTEVRVMRRDGTGVLRLMNGRRLPTFGADFSPDSRWIVLTAFRERARSHFDLYKVRVDGSRRARLIRRGKATWSPDW